MNGEESKGDASNSILMEWVASNEEIWRKIVGHLKKLKSLDNSSLMKLQ